MLAAEVRRIVGRRGSYWSALLIGFGAVVIMIIVRLDAGRRRRRHRAARRDGADLARRHADGRARGRARRVVRHRPGHHALPRDDRRAAPPAVRDARAGNRDRDDPLLPARDRRSASSRPTPSATATFNEPTLRSVAGAIWAYLVNPVVYGLVSVAVGSLLRSNGAAIGVSLGFAFGGGILTGVIGNFISETLASYLLPAAAPIVASLDRNADISLAAAFAALAVWLVASSAPGSGAP